MMAPINTRKMRYSGVAITSLKSHHVDVHHHAYGSNPVSSKDIIDEINNNTGRVWSKQEHRLGEPRLTDELRHRIGTYPLTSRLAQWVYDATTKYQPSDQVQELVGPFQSRLHSVFEKEREASSGLHDLDLVELTYQITLEVAAHILQAADATKDPITIQVAKHSSRSARDDHFLPWGKLLTGFECNPPIISQFPTYLMMCNAFTFESTPSRDDYVFSALTGIDWVKGKSSYSRKFEAFEKMARASVPSLDDKVSGRDRSFWRGGLAYLSAINDCENSRKFNTPKRAAIEHNIDFDLLIACRAFDTFGTAFMCSDGAAWMDEAGMDSLIGSALPNDIMDLHTDILTGETRNLLRLLYPPGLNIDETMHIVSSLFSGMLCELFRGHRRARFDGREDGRIAATSPSYSFSRARHRRVFETIELYSCHYPQFWDWTWKIYRQAKLQVTQAALDETLANTLKRASTFEPLPPSEPVAFYGVYWDMIENCERQRDDVPSFGVSEDLTETTREIYQQWHEKLLANDKQSGWGKKFDERSDELFARAGTKFLEKGDTSDDMYKFAIAYGRLSMAVPYIAYHTIAAIIMAFGTLAP